MLFSAQCYSCEDSYRVTDVVWTSERLSLDWSEGGDIGHLEAATTDGVVYNGHYGYKNHVGNRHVKFTLFRSAVGELLFLGRWWNTTDGGAGDWAFRLTPKPAD